MKVHTEYLKFHTRKHREYIHITPQVEAIVRKSGIREGMVLVSAMHITAGGYLDDKQSRRDRDIDHGVAPLAAIPARRKDPRARSGQVRSRPQDLLVVHPG